jgi:hypothetical protein
MQGPDLEVEVTHEAYLKALKKAQSSDTRGNFMLIKLSYDCTVCVPYKDGVSFMAALEKAENYHDRYSEPKRIDEWKKDAIETKVLSAQEYLRIKIAGLLHVKPEDLKQFEIA